MSVTGVNSNPFQGKNSMRKEPSPGETLVVYALAVVYVLAASRLFRLQEPRWWNLLFPIGLAAIPVAVSAVRGLSLSAVFPVSPAPFRETAGALLLVPLVLVFLLPLAQLVAPWLPVPDSEDPAIMEGLLSGGFVYAFLFIVLLPALCEEILFRGFILSGLRDRFGKWSSIILCALLFAALHLEPARIPFALIPGIAITAVGWKTRSLVLPVLMHFLHNGILFYLLWTTAAGSGGTSLPPINSVFP